MSEMIQAFGQGWMVGEAITQSREKRKALNAAVEQYGDVARDPGLFSALRNYDIAGTSEARAQKGFDQAYDITAKNESRVDTQFQNSQQDRQKQAVLGLVNGLRTARDRGEDIGTAFDKLADTLPSLGVNPDDIPAMRQAVIDNPAILDDYYASLTTGAPGRAGAAGAPNKPGAADDNSALVRASDDIFNRIAILREPGRQSAAKSIFGMGSGGMIGGAVTQGGFGQFGSVPGSPASDYASNLDALSGDIRSAAFETLKGGGQITEKESEFAANAIAKISRSTSYEEYTKELDRLEAYMKRLMDAAGRRAAGEDVPDITSGEAAAPSPAKPTGPTQIYPGYVNPKTGAKFKGGDWKDPANWEMPE